MENENCQTTSTPKKPLNAEEASLLLINTDEDELNYVYEHDSSINNTPYIDTSSSFSDNSDFSLSRKEGDGSGMRSRKSRTEPPLNKIYKQSNLVQATALEFSPTSANGSTRSIFKTPPWKPMSSFNSNGGLGGGAETTPTGPTRQKLFFDDEKERKNNNNNNNMSNNNNSQANKKNLLLDHSPASSSSSPITSSSSSSSL